jgi:antimicrobial peptide system SdpB family protein
MKRELISGINKVSKEYSKKNPWTQVYGLARSILALGTFLTLLFNKNDVLFTKLTREVGDGYILLSRINFFYLFGFRYLNISVWISIAFLSLVIIGWRPRITCLFHWWITSSFIESSRLLDGGDQIASIISLLLIPIALTDNRKWHWNYGNIENKAPLLILFIWSVLFMIRFQVAFIYFNAGVEKLKIQEWKDGTSIYYWFTNDIYGTNDIFKGIIFYLTSNGLIVTLLTYGTLIFEIVLGMSFFMRRNSINWKILFIFGIFFHLGIAVIFGLVSFFTTMASSLLLFLIPIDYFNNRKIVRINNSKVS